MRNPNFTGRREHLRRLHKSLTSRKAVAVQAVRGMGGIGKTQLAIEYCHTRAKGYDVVWWVSAEDLTLVPGQLAQLGTALGLKLSDNATESAATVVSDLHRRRRWLLVFDNAESVAGLRQYIPSGGRVLVTTRRAGFDAIGDVLDLDTMPRAESIALLRRRGVPAEQAEELARLLGDLPLGLEQAAAYLRQSGCPVSEFLNLLRHTPDKAAVRGRDAHRLTDNTRTFGADDIAAGIAAHHVGTVLRDLGRPASAKPFDERALRIAEATYGVDDPRLCVPLGDLGLTLLSLGRPAATRAELGET